MTSSNTSKRVAARLLGAVHGGVGLADDVVDVLLGVGDDVDADADRDRPLLSGERDRQAGGLGDALGDERGLLVAVQALEQEGELVAAEAGDGVHRAQHRAEALGETTRSRSPAPCPSVSLISLKPSTSRNSTTTGAPVRRLRSRAPAQAVQEQRPVGQRGQRVVQRLLGERRLAALALHRVADRAGQERRGLSSERSRIVLSAGPHHGDAGVLVIAVGQHDDRRRRDWPISAPPAPRTAAAPCTSSSTQVAP